MLKPEDLLVDDRFVAWSMSEGKLHQAYWEAWLVKSDEHQEIAHQAQLMLQELHFQDVTPEIATDAAWQKLQQQLTQEKPKRIYLLARHWQKAAAILLIGLAAWFMWPNSSDFRTDFAEQQQLTLPDGTTVNLRANSHLWWEDEWAAQGVREVHLEGEAYFDVSPANTQAGMPFVVKANTLGIKVMGTEFNVVNRSNRRQVTLVEGSVSIVDQGQPFQVLRPAQQYYWQANEPSQIREVTTAIFTDWRNDRWHFDQMPLSEIALRIEEHYGKDVIIANGELQQHSLSGTAPAKNLKMLINAISVSLGINAQIDGERIMFSAKQPQ
ncbi:FecR family protein [Lewinella cohaerens]|uniref:FecR family protein n=1 Tax=Lewinella cohaerens TaxID=70995 RepID=UPI000374ABEB|nr:FecR domain-containing protein [Lewinella cohaerens]